MVLFTFKEAKSDFMTPEFQYYIALAFPLEHGQRGPGSQVVVKGTAKHNHVFVGHITLTLVMRVYFNRRTNDN